MAKPFSLRAFAIASAVLAVSLAGLHASAPFDSAQGGPAAAGDVTFTKDIAPILQRSCQHCHHPEGVAPMSLVTYEEVRPWARAMKTRTGSAQPARRDAAVVRREEHRHPEVQGRPLAQRRGDRQDREVGRQRRAARQSGRHAAAARLRQHRQVDDRRAGSGPAVAGRDRAGDRSRQVGRLRARADRAHRGSLRVGGRSARGQRHSAEAARPRPSAAATSSTT